MFWQNWFNLNTTHGLTVFFQNLIIDTWFNILASVICGVALYFTVLKKMFVCKEKWCFRIGHHKVDGTHYKTCNKHATPEIHKKWQHKHSAKYPEQHEFLKSKQ